MLDTAAEYSELKEWGGWGGVRCMGCRFWLAARWADVLQWAGKTKGQGQECRGGTCREERTTAVLRVWCHHNHHHHHSPSSWVTWPLREIVVYSPQSRIYAALCAQCEHLSILFSFKFLISLPTHTLTHTRNTHTQTHTLGFQDLDCLLSSLSALVYSAWILLAGTMRSPSDLVTTTKSALSMMPLLMPCTDIWRMKGSVIYCTPCDICIFTNCVIHSTCNQTKYHLGCLMFHSYIRTITLGWLQHILMRASVHKCWHNVSL